MLRPEISHVILSIFIFYMLRHRYEITFYPVSFHFFLLSFSFRRSLPIEHCIVYSPLYLSSYSFTYLPHHTLSGQRCLAGCGVGAVHQYSSPICDLKPRLCVFFLSISC